jgi:CO dehydrogenase/acetyl-CoA synthase beta subunit
LRQEEEKEEEEEEEEEKEEEEEVEVSKGGEAWQRRTLFWMEAAREDKGLRRKKRR